ncbi:hypothetical protein V6N11_055467 [Hibiscus sabdariffa]|uniref:Uncharacterized protein n=1 Tax=Hibiscus sabdariffa TaxID=183260 RepID=A0ABR2PFC6_9ROSI
MVTSSIVQEQEEERSEGGTISWNVKQSLLKCQPMEYLQRNVDEVLISLAGDADTDAILDLQEHVAFFLTQKHRIIETLEITEGKVGSKEC